MLLRRNDVGSFDVLRTLLLVPVTCALVPAAYAVVPVASHLALLIIRTLEHQNFEPTKCLL